MSAGEYYSADAWPVTVGAKFWDNNLRVVQVTEVAVDSNPYPDGETQTWHQTTSGRVDTISGKLSRIGRLAREFEGLNAEKFKPGTDYRTARRRRD